jgi:hypothetical protein
MSFLLSFAHCLSIANQQLDPHPAILRPNIIQMATAHLLIYLIIVISKYTGHSPGSSIIEE